MAEPGNGLVGADPSRAWCDGRIFAASQETAPGDGCYSTALWTGQRVRWCDRVAARLARDARALGFGRVDEVRTAAGMHALGEAAFGSAPGVVRFEARAGAGSHARVLGSTRPLGESPPLAKAARSTVAHPGPDATAPGAKFPRPAIGQARVEREERGLDEVLMLDREGFLVEGSRTTPIVACADGSWATPPPARGGVRGVALEVLSAAEPRVGARDLRIADLARAREIVLVNAVRGALPVGVWEGTAIGFGHLGDLARTIGAALAD